MKTYGEGVQHHAFLTSALNGDECSASCPERFTPVKEHRYSLKRRMIRPQNLSRYGEEEKNSLS
jgi:hypothetical protein